jgi:hypothetical protein
MLEGSTQFESIYQLNDRFFTFFFLIANPMPLHSIEILDIVEIRMT